MPVQVKWNKLTIKHNSVMSLTQYNNVHYRYTYFHAH